MKNLGILYVVPTPIGNLKDITLRALEILQSVHYIAAEDTRVAKKLLNHYKISAKLISYHKFNEKEKASAILKILLDGNDLALISDAGTPGISDPGIILIQEAIKNELEVQTLPGATAFVPALVNSGFDISNFFFAGFLPKKLKEQMILMEKIKSVDSVVIFYEAPHRIIKMLKLLYSFLGDRQVYIAREITKLYETNYRGYISQYIANNEITEKGEFVVILNKVTERNILNFDEIIEKVKIKINGGMSEKDAIRLISKEFNVSKNKLYDFFYQDKNK